MKDEVTFGNFVKFSQGEEKGKSLSELKSYLFPDEKGVRNLSMRSYSMIKFKETDEREKDNHSQGR